MTKLITILILTLGVFTCFSNQIKTGNLIKKDSSALIKNILEGKEKTTNITNLKDIESKNDTKNNNSFNLDKNSVLQDSISNLIGGLIFTLLIFGLNEYVFIQKNISGEWDAKNKIAQSSYNPHIGITIEYKVHLLQLGNQISGRGEKIRDLNPDGSLHTEYSNKGRVEIEINGHYKRNFLSRSKLYLLIKENGNERVTSTSFELTIPIFNSKDLIGKFVWTASNSKGTTNWAKIG
ncbi:MAG: hypothetical protein Q7J19_04850 [Lutibacter sp.]|nr:hypothetical protein [Lutibacter sp.]